MFRIFRSRQLGGANSKNSTDSWTASRRAREFAQCAHVFSSPPVAYCIRQSARGDGGGITCRARGRRRNLYGKHRTPKGLRERVSLKSSEGNEGFTAVRDGGGVKTPPGPAREGEEAERNTAKSAFKWNEIARDPA